jgi:hypothetical protein
LLPKVKVCQRDRREVVSRHLPHRELIILDITIPRLVPKGFWMTAELFAGDIANPVNSAVSHQSIGNRPGTASSWRISSIGSVLPQPA